MPLRTTATNEEIRAEFHPFISVNMGPFPKLLEFLARLREKGSNQTTNREEASRRLAGAAFASLVLTHSATAHELLGDYQRSPADPKHVHTIIPVI